MSEVRCCLGIGGQIPVAGCLVCNEDWDDQSHRKHRIVLLNNCILNGVCVLVCLLCTMAKMKGFELWSESESEILIRPNYDTQATHFIPLPH